MTNPTADEQDRESMARLAAGQDSALDDLMARHAQRLYHYLLRVLQNDSEASDLAEETFVRVYQNRLRFQTQRKFSTWLYAIATNLARDLKRHHSRHPNVPLEAEHPEHSQSLRDVLPDPALSPSESIQKSERAAIVRAAVAALPEDLRVPLILAEYEDKSHAEIGAILDCTAKAVEMRLYRARQELRLRLAPYCRA